MFVLNQFLLSVSSGPTATVQRSVSDPSRLLSEEYDVWCACWEAFYSPGVWVEIDDEEPPPAGGNK